MGIATTHTVALRGAVGHLIDVQADVSPGKVGLTLVGRGDAAINEGRDRIRMAVLNSGLDWPSTRRITLLLSPADLPKEGSHYDLGMAVAVLSAAEIVDPCRLHGVAFIGELGLDGGLRAVTGVLPMAMAAAQRGIRSLVVPEPQAGEAAMVPGMSVLGFRSLAQVVAELCGQEVPEAAPVPEPAGGHVLGWRGESRLEETDMSDLIGMHEVRYAVEVAAAGGHHLLLKGPRGCGKTSIAERIPTILPDLEPDQSLELTAVRSLAGVLDPSGGLVRRPPFSAPHHDASKASVIGGGHGRVRPGAISLAHGGVLFLDEFPLLTSDVIESLREPLESGDITIARADEAVTLPAQSIVVLAANPCPCGDFDLAVGADRCHCRPAQRRDYRARLDGPLTDRIDIVRPVRPPGPHESGPFSHAEDSAVIRARIEAARSVQRARFAGTSWRLNAQVSGAALRDRWPLPPVSVALLEQLILRGELSRRGAVRVHRLAWTVADLAGLERPGPAQAETALALRQGAPLPVAVYERRTA